ncbi:MAG: hypothetical protein F4Z01_01020 [Gammaproteobacteria bacterium]|nr:hypothetical protein [Gammaproteobacteria bacterium]MYF38889.1 hypothetical protein [Gammaproteobacteria bacterium]
MSEYEEIVKLRGELAAASRTIAVLFALVIRYSGDDATALRGSLPEVIRQIAVSDGSDAGDPLQEGVDRFTENLLVQFSKFCDVQDESPEDTWN